MCSKTDCPVKRHTRNKISTKAQRNTHTLKHKHILTLPQTYSDSYYTSLLTQFHNLTPTLTQAYPHTYINFLQTYKAYSHTRTNLLTDLLHDILSPR